MSLTPRVTYPGIERINRASYTLAHGITPGVVEVEFAPQRGTPALLGDVVFSDGQNSVRLTRCKFVSGSSRRNAQGLTYSAQLSDRRWAWQFGSIYGEYNMRDESQQTIPKDDRRIVGIEKTPQELCRLLLDKMGEPQGDVSQVPNTTRPHVKWEAANPAHELAELCDLLGLRVVLGLDNLVHLVRLGSGSQMPNTQTIEASLTIDPPEGPDSVEVVGDEIRVQERLELEAVGEDTDGVIKPIDQLSYKPTNGWEKENALFSGVSGDQLNQLAVKSVWRYYRVKDALSIDPHQLPSTIKISNVDQILPLYDSLLETEKDDGSNTPRKKKARILGVYNLNLGGVPFKNSSKTEEYEFKGQWRLDGERALVVFADPIVKRTSATTGNQPADLYLECSFGVRDQNTGHRVRWGYELTANKPKLGTGPEVVHSDTLALELYQSYDQTTHVKQAWQAVRELSDLEQESEYLALQTLYKYQTTTPQDGSFPGFLPVSPDGAIVQVTWSMSPLPTTRVSRGVETHFPNQPYNFRRFNEIVKGISRKRRLQPFANAKHLRK